MVSNANGNGNGGIRIPAWLSGIAVTAVLGFVVWVWQTTDAKAQVAYDRATVGEQRQAVLEVQLAYILKEVTEGRADLREVKALLLSLIENPTPRSRGGR
jgi:hypothetical protein